MYMYYIIKKVSEAKGCSGDSSFDVFHVTSTYNTREYYYWYLQQNPSNVILCLVNAFSTFITQEDRRVCLCYK